MDTDKQLREALTEALNRHYRIINDDDDPVTEEEAAFAHRLETALALPPSSEKTGELREALEAAELVILAYEDRDFAKQDGSTKDHEANIQQRREAWGKARAALAHPSTQPISSHEQELQAGLKEIADEERRCSKSDCSLGKTSPESDRICACGYPMIASAETEPAGLSQTVTWPDELTPALREILGRPCFMFIRWASLYRAAGYEIPTSAEDEQAFFLHRYLCHWFKAGDKWMDAANEEIKAVREKAKAAELARKKGAQV